ncbi:MAG: DUF1254 domain-containing protein [Ignavibacteriaceae bacterium]|nr:DUF1254 domain-containing protein [Ignavibacteriaceae bacterium]
MKKIISVNVAILLIAIISLALTSCSREVTPEEARQISKEAYIYGFPMVDSYRIMFAYFVDKENPEYKTSFNQIKNIPRVYTPEDKAVQSPNSDTPYSMMGLDLRAEPIVLTVPLIEKDRYFSIQLVDQYTFNFDYIGSRTTGNNGGSYLIAGPNWNGEKPEGINKVFKSETEFVLAIYRTQLFNPSDLDNVIKIQDGYKAQTLSEFLGKPAPPPAPIIDFITPLTPEEEKTSLKFYDILNFWLQFCPIDPSETELMSRFAKIGIGGGMNFDSENLSPEIKEAIEQGMKDAWIELSEFEKTELVTNKVTSGDVFGTRTYLKNNYLYRFAAAVIGIFGNSKDEAMYPFYRTDAAGNALNGKENNYTIYFAPDAFPPVNAFWSLTMYNLPQSLLAANPINRYLINSPMLPELKKDANGGVTIYIQNNSPGKEKESNWLPAPDGPFWMALRLYWPKQAALDGSWKQPPLETVKK